MLVSENELDIADKMFQNLINIVNINWKLHCIYRPQSSG